MREKCTMRSVTFQRLYGLTHVKASNVMTAEKCYITKTEAQCLINHTSSEGNVAYIGECYSVLPIHREADIFRKGPVL